MSPIQALMVATHLNVGTVARGTEAVSQTYRGSELGGEQSFRLCAGLGTFASIYMKTRHLNKATRVLRFLPDVLTEWLIEYFVLIRPVETQFSQLFYGQDTAYSYQRFMWMQQGCRVDSMVLSRGIGQIANLVMGNQDPRYTVRFNLHMWRQVSKAILSGVVLREVPQIYNFTPVDDTHPALHYGYGHSKAIGESRYGVDSAKFSAITEGQTLAMQDLCQRYHAWCQVADISNVSTYLSL